MTVAVMESKDRARRIALDRRRASKSAAANATANDHLFDFIKEKPSETIVSGYMAIRTEIDPLPALTRLSAAGFRLCMPVIQGRGLPLLFREWTPDSQMIEGDFGALIPRGGDYLVPNLLIVPLLAFDDNGQRMGYGGGFYDRSLELIRSKGPITAAGFAFEGQRSDPLPCEPTDQPLDLVVTEKGPHYFA